MYYRPKQSNRTFIYDIPSWARNQLHTAKKDVDQRDTSSNGNDKRLGDQSGRGFLDQRREGRVTLLEEQVAIQAGTTGLRTWQV